MGAGAAGCAMDRPRLLLLLLGVSASRRGARSLARDRNPRGSGFPEGKQNQALGSQMLGMGGGRGAAMPGPTEARLGSQGAEETLRSRVEMRPEVRTDAGTPVPGCVVWRSWEGLRGGVLRFSEPGFFGRGRLNARTSRRLSPHPSQHLDFWGVVGQNPG